MSETQHRLPRAERRTQLIGAAAPVFLAGGYDGTSMEQVADAAGVTRLIVYRVFESKEALYRAVLASVTDDLRVEWEAAVATGIDALPGGIAGVVLRVARRHPDAFRLLWRHASHEPLFAAEADAFRVIVADFAAGFLAPYLADRTVRRWASAAIVDHLYGGICTWLDTGAISRDDEFAVTLQAGMRAMVDAWSNSRTTGFPAASSVRTTQVRSVAGCAVSD